MRNLTSQSSAAAVRHSCRQGGFTSPTAGLAAGYVQANLVVLPQRHAWDFLVFCQRNAQACPLLEVLEMGEPVPRYTAQDADLRFDLPRYYVYQHGKLHDEVTQIDRYWRADLISFLLGCSFSFEAALLAEQIPVRHIAEDKNVPMYRTTIPCVPAGIFSGPMVVSMRPMTMANAIRAIAICQRFPLAHGAPIHVGDPAAIGIPNINQPDYGDAVTMHPDEVPVFWACGVTPQAALLYAKPELAITHAPGHMFLTDLQDWQMQQLSPRLGFSA